MRRPPRTTLFPSATLFRSAGPAAVDGPAAGGAAVGRRAGRGDGDRRHHRRAVAQGVLSAASVPGIEAVVLTWDGEDWKSTRLNSSHANISNAVLCLKNKKN